ncbi:hypothetical protein [Bradyrhizobium sp. CCBAU 65884]|uniref:Nmad2 family putative nucleotide modification protein n=1 Tax=Bradyrhizobium sp. CCBAU 65884 TaxID=722477 RepID=UPI002306096C|nr:hypothetical protein [Bradyrhizobium sp. CCBAU 65884]
MSLYTYVVRYDSGFAPNPFYGFCTLATCKPKIRRYAKVGDWLLGSGSGDKKIGRAGYLVYAMRVSEALSFDDYDVDPRFRQKKPYRTGSRKQSCGDSIYFREISPGSWSQRDSFHSLPDGSANLKHIGRDTSVNRVLVSDHFIYFGGTGPSVPTSLKDELGRRIVHSSLGQSRFDDAHLLEEFECWVRSLGDMGYRGPPYEWLHLRRSNVTT